MTQSTWVSQLEITTPDEMHELGVTIGHALQAGDLIILNGALGAGKTTLTRGIGEGMGVRGPVTSPTFVLARTHPSQRGGAPLVHVDAYRLAGPEELDDLDLDFECSAVVIEWGGDMVDTVPRLEITLTRETGAAPDGDETVPEIRTVECVGFGDRWSKGLTNETV